MNCNDCIHNCVCYRLEIDSVSWDYANKCGDFKKEQEPCIAISRLDKIRQIIEIPNSIIQEDVMKYKMICEVLK